MMRKNPIRAIFDFRREEISIAVLMFSFFFIFIMVFQILRPLKKGYFVELFGAEPELYIRLFSIAVAVLAVTVFTFLYNRLSRQKLIIIFSLFFTAAFIALRFLIAQQTLAIAWWYYLQVDLVTTIWVAIFFAYLTDITTADQAKRLYGFVGAGGVIGGVVGALVAKILFGHLGENGLLLLSAGLMLVLMAINYAVETLLKRSDVFGQTEDNPRPEKEPQKSPSKFTAAIEGARLAFHSKYLASIVGIMAFYEISSQVITFMYTKKSEIISGMTSTQSFFIDTQLFANILSVVVQLFLVSFIMRKLGLGFALNVLPVAALICVALFMGLPGLTTASLLFISDNGFNYSIQQTAREALYVPTSADEKYKARAFTNMFVQRAAKGIGVGAIFLLTSLGVSTRALGILAIITLAAMGGLGIYSGKQFNKRT